MDAGVRAVVEGDRQVAGLLSHVDGDGGIRLRTTSTLCPLTIDQWNDTLAECIQLCALVGKGP